MHDRKRKNIEKELCNRVVSIFGIIGTMLSLYYHNWGTGTGGVLTCALIMVALKRAVGFDWTLQLSIQLEAFKVSALTVTVEQRGQILIQLRCVFNVRHRFLHFLSADDVGLDKPINYS